MKRADDITSYRRLPNAAWAWEFLRRNPAYRADFRAAQQVRVERRVLPSGSIFYIARDPLLQAQNHGLLRFANPDKRAIDADVFWHPDLLAGALRVKLTRPDETVMDAADPHDTIILSALQTRRVMLQTLDGARHILLNGERFWIHLYSIKRAPPDDFAAIDMRLDGAKHMLRRIDTATQLLSLHRSSDGKLSLIGRRKNAERLTSAIMAYDIWHGFERPKGGLRDIAIALRGEAQVNEDWTGSSRYLKDFARRARDRGDRLVSGGYRDLLTRKTI